MVVTGFVAGFAGQDCGGGGGGVDCGVAMMGGFVVKQCFGDGGVDGGVSLMGLMGVGCGMCGFDGFCFNFLLQVLWLMVVAFDLLLIFCCGMCGFDGGGRDGSLWVYCGMGSLWWIWLWFGSDLGFVGIWFG